MMRDRWGLGRRYWAPGQGPGGGSVLTILVGLGVLFLLAYVCGRFA